MAVGVYPRISVLERFEQKIEYDPNGGCWFWTAGCDRDGYGDFWLEQTVKAHRVSWQLYRGQISDDLWVLHRCDIPTCVNPDHLFLGKALDNEHDKMSKGRKARGEDHPLAKLKDSDIPEIRRRVDAGELLDRIAADYGVMKANISAIRHRRLWGHIP